MNGIQDAWIAQCRGVAFALQFELGIEVRSAKERGATLRARPYTKRGLG
jgi:hypothetical protein